MRIGVITFFQTKDNYGQVLQCYALQQVLLQLGHQPYIIRYGFHETYFHWLKKKYFKNGTGFHTLLLHIYHIISKHHSDDIRQFAKFKEKHIIKSLRCYNNLNELKRHPPKADCYIAGGDQIWAQLLSDSDNKSFFLDFGDESTYRISYAPSFALPSYPEELKKALSSQLAKFRAISVREYSGVHICADVGYNATLVIDPTLLLYHKTYSEMAILPASDNPYCFIYHVNVSSCDDIFIDYFTEYNRTHKIATKAVYANEIKGINNEIIADAEYSFPTIPEWLGLISASEYIYTTSFHGVVFAIIFHKSFYVCLRKTSMFDGNDRITTLLSLLNLTERIIDPNSPQSININPLGEIDWASVDEKLEQLRMESLSFLRNNLRG